MAKLSSVKIVRIPVCAFEVEVKGQEVSEAVDPDDLTGNDDDSIKQPEQGNEKRDAAPAPAAKAGCR